MGGGTKEGVSFPAAGKRPKERLETTGVALPEVLGGRRNPLSAPGRDEPLKGARGLGPAPPRGGNAARGSDLLGSARGAGRGVRGAGRGHRRARSWGARCDPGALSAVAMASVFGKPRAGSGPPSAPLEVNLAILGRRGAGKSGEWDGEPWFWGSGSSAGFEGFHAQPDPISLCDFSSLPQFLHCWCSQLFRACAQPLGLVLRLGSWLLFPLSLSCVAVTVTVSAPTLHPLSLGLQVLALLPSPLSGGGGASLPG